MLQRVEHAEDSGAAGHVVIGAVGERGRVVMRGQRDPFVAFAGQLRNHVVRFALVFALTDDDAHALRFVFYQRDRRGNVEHGAEKFSLFADDVCAQIAFVDVAVAVVQIAVLEQNALRTGFDQVLIAEKTDA